MLPKYNGGKSIWHTFSFQKEEMGEKEGLVDSKRVQNLARQIALDLEVHK